MIIIDIYYFNRSQFSNFSFILIPNLIVFSISLFFFNKIYNNQKLFKILLTIAIYILVSKILLPLNIDELALVPYSESNKLFKIESGNIEKGKVVVQVFEVSTDFASFMDGIDADNKGIDLQKPLMVGSMVEPKINGNWGE